MKFVEIEDALQPGEKLLWQGSPSGWNFELWTLGCGFLLFTPNIFMFAFLIMIALGYRPELIPVLALGSVVALAAFALLYEIARMRGERYAVTDRRVIVLDHRGKLAGLLEREHGLDAVVVKRDVVVRAGSGFVRFHGIDEPGLVLTALGLAGKPRA